MYGYFLRNNGLFHIHILHFVVTVFNTRPTGRDTYSVMDIQPVSLNSSLPSGSLCPHGQCQGICPSIIALVSCLMIYCATTINSFLPYIQPYLLHIPRVPMSSPNTYGCSNVCVSFICSVLSLTFSLCNSLIRSNCLQNPSDSAHCRINNLFCISF